VDITVMRLLYDGDPVDGYFVISVNASEHEHSVYRYFIAGDRRIFDASDMSDLIPLE